MFATSGADWTTWQVPLSGSQLQTPLTTGGASSDTTNGPAGTAINPQGTFIASGNTDGSVDIFAVSGGTIAGSPTQTVQATNGANPNVMGLAFDPTGSYLVTANGPSNDVTLFTFDSSQGAANSTGELVLPGSSPAQVLFHPNGTIVYVSNAGSNPATISGFTVTPTGLQPLPGAPFALSANVKGPTGLAIK
jgi:WD40 repeat protein